MTKPDIEKGQNGWDSKGIGSDGVEKGTGRGKMGIQGTVEWRDLGWDEADLTSDNSD